MAQHIALTFDQSSDCGRAPNKEIDSHEFQDHFKRSGHNCYSKIPSPERRILNPSPPFDGAQLYSSPMELEISCVEATRGGPTGVLLKIRRSFPVAMARDDAPPAAALAASSNRDAPDRIGALALPRIGTQKFHAKQRTKVPCHESQSRICWFQIDRISRFR